MQATRSDRLRASLPLPPLRASRLEFGLDDLHDLRAQVAATATAVGLSPARVSDLVAATVQHAVRGELRGGGDQIGDAGQITDPEVGTRLPDPTVEHGRGLYIANRLCDEVAIDSGESGTRVRLRMAAATD